MRQLVTKVLNVAQILVQIHAVVTNGVYLPLRQSYWSSKIWNVTAEIQVNISGQSIWNMWWARWHWDIILLANSLYPVSKIRLVLHNHI